MSQLEGELQRRRWRQRFMWFMRRSGIWWSVTVYREVLGFAYLVLAH